MNESKAKNKQENIWNTNTNHIHMDMGNPIGGNIILKENFLGYNLTGALYKCEDCTTEKVVRKNISKH